VTTPHEILAYLNRAARREYDRMEAQLQKSRQAVARRTAERDIYREEAERLRGILESLPNKAGYLAHLARHEAREGRII
jgi:hypothetical protein